MMPIWQRYFLRRFLKNLAALLALFFSFYFLFDYAHRTHHFTLFQGREYWSVVAEYYLSDFIRRIDILLPFSLLIAIVATLNALTFHREIVVLLTNGIRLHRLLMPFVVVGFLAVGAVYVSEQFVLPKALSKLRAIEEVRLAKKRHRNEQAAVHHLLLADGGRLLFSHYSTEKEAFEEVVWIPSFDEIWRMRQLTVEGPIGQWVEKIERDDQGRWAVAGHFSERLFSEISFDQRLLLETVTPLEELSLVQLWKGLPRSRTEIGEKEAEWIALFHRRMAIPWLCLLAVMGPAPFCVCLTRRLPPFLIYGGSIFGLFACYLLLNAALILGKGQVFSPIWAIWTPFIAFFGFFLPPFMRLR